MTTFTDPILRGNPVDLLPGMVCANNRNGQSGTADRLPKVLRDGAMDAYTSCPAAGATSCATRTAASKPSNPLPPPMSRPQGRPRLQSWADALENTMTHSEFDFETWFDSLAAMVLDESGVEFRDAESVRDDYNAGRNLADVAKEIADDYR